MSDTPGNPSQPRDNRGGNRNRNRSRNNRGPRRDDNRRDEPRRSGGPRRENRREDRRPRSDIERVGSNPRRSGKAPAPPLTFGQKLLRVLTFGLVNPGAKKPAPRPEHKPRPAQPERKEPARQPREPRQTAPIPPPDVEAVQTDRLHVGNLSYDASESDLMDLFNGIGKVASADIVYNGRTHRSKGFGFVQMMSIADARRAVAELHGKPFMGRPLLLGPARSRGRDEREADDEQE